MNDIQFINGIPMIEYMGQLIPFSEYESRSRVDSIMNISGINPSDYSLENTGGSIKDQGFTGVGEYARYPNLVQPTGQTTTTVTPRTTLTPIQTMGQREVPLISTEQGGDPIFAQTNPYAANNQYEYQVTTTKGPSIFDRIGGYFSNFGNTKFGKNLNTPQAMIGVAQGVGGIMQGLIGRGKRKRAQAAAQAEYDKMRQEYMNLDTSNLFAGAQNRYLNMENAYEDLTVNQQQAEFERNMFSQQQANVMANLRGAAGSSGIAGLAQAISNQALVQSQKAAGSIGLQESKNQLYRAREAGRIQELQRKDDVRVEQTVMRGAQVARDLEYQKTGTLFGMSQQDLAAANQAIAASNQALYGGVGQIGGTLAMAAISDRRAKKNIKLMGNSPSGLNIYSFEYINPALGKGVYQGVMSDEIPSNAVVYSNGYNMVNYSLLDVEFKRIN